MNNPIYRYDIEQNTDEWFEIKLGKFSASIANDLLMDKSNKGYKSLINRIVEERITLRKCENNLFKGNWATDRGHELEPIAREDFELRTLQVVKIIGVVEKNDWVLCSPDGLIGADKLHQIKCPIFSTQKDYLEKLNNGKSPISTAYYRQLQFELYVTNRDINIFTSFHPNLKPIDIEIKRDNQIIDFIDFRIKEAKKEVLQQIEIINNY